MIEVLLAVLSFGFGALALWGALRIRGDLARSRGWPTTPGRILERGVGEAMSTRSFLPHVRYTYTVGGTEYVNDQVYRIRRTGGSREGVQRLVDGLPDPVPVRYDPADPATAFLIENPPATVWILLGMAALGLALGLGRLLLLWAP